MILVKLNNKSHLEHLRELLKQFRYELHEQNPSNNPNKYQIMICNFITNEVSRLTIKDNLKKQDRVPFTTANCNVDRFYN